jgi:carbon-monoxide dehydrogenase medium subunit
MRNSPEQILRPKTPEEAGALLEKLGDDVGVLWLGARVEPPSTWARASMIDLSGLDLDYIRVGEDSVLIGTATPLQRLVEDASLEAAFGGLVNTAARRLAHYGLRNLASIGGALTAPAGGPPELALALLVLGSEAVFVGATQTRVPIEQLGSGRALAASGLLAELRLPRGPAASQGWGLEWLARSPMDQALVAACAAVELRQGKLISPKVAVAGLGWPPARVDLAENALEGASASAWGPEKLRRTVTDAVDPAPEFRASAGYQKQMMGRLAVRAVAAAVRKAGNA